MDKSVTTRSRIAEYSTYLGLALWLAAWAAAWWEGHFFLGCICVVAGMVLIVGAVLIGRPERQK